MQTSFDQGVTRFTWLMIYFMLVMVPLVFLINGLTKHHWMDAFFFALAVAVGLTPEMLPMIVSVCLSRGAIAMSRKKVIVKRLNSIQNLGAMDVLCTDKTGTLTLDRVILERHCDVVRHEDEGVLVLAYLNSHFQTGLRRTCSTARSFSSGDSREVLRARLQEGRRDPLRFFPQIDVGGGRDARGEPPPDLQGRHGGRLPAMHVASSWKGRFIPIDPLLITDLKEECDELSADGFRVLAIAYKDVETGGRPTRRTTSGS